MSRKRDRKEYPRQLHQRGGSVMSTIPMDVIKREAYKAGLAVWEFVVKYELVVEVEPGLMGRTYLSFRRIQEVS